MHNIGEEIYTLGKIIVPILINGSLQDVLFIRLFIYIFSHEIGGDANHGNKS